MPPVSYTLSTRPHVSPTRTARGCWPRCGGCCGPRLPSRATTAPDTVSIRSLRSGPESVDGRGIVHDEPARFDVGLDAERVPSVPRGVLRRARRSHRARDRPARGDPRARPGRARRSRGDPRLEGRGRASVPFEATMCCPGGALPVEVRWRPTDDDLVVASVRDARERSPAGRPRWLSSRPRPSTEPDRADPPSSIPTTVSTRPT